MTESSSTTAKQESPANLLKTALATIAVIILILALGLIGNQLYEIEEQLARDVPLAVAEGASLPAHVVVGGRAVYVPAYSHIYTGQGTPTPLAVTLSVRNTDPEHAIRIERVRYFDGEGRQLREMTEDGPVALKPMQTHALLIEQQQGGGGSGANFLVEWSAEETVNRPIIEAIMVGDGGLSFKSRGEPIERR
ncbi:MAG: DUF3124 domain-containing protein [Thiohalocapsa sp.]|nr:DUF3124 domain-containing protein [Thiohalocapsa sp.]MCF7991471.1 DUF3124 domain-containing protein [Thiohalocapsa sp.]